MNEGPKGSRSIFMMLGQAAGTAGALALEQGMAVQDVPYDDLKNALLDSGQVLEAPGFYEDTINKIRANPKWALLVMGASFFSLLFGFSVGRFVRFPRSPKRLRT